MELGLLSMLDLQAFYLCARDCLCTTMREVGGEDPDSEENISTFWDSVEIKQKNVTMSLVDCPGCNKRLRILEAYSGIITCPNCNKVFKRENEQIGNNLYDSKGRPMVLTNAQRRAGMTPSDVAVQTVVSGGLSILFYTIIFFMFIIYTIASWQILAFRLILIGKITQEIPH